MKSRTNKLSPFKYTRPPSYTLHDYDQQAIITDMTPDSGRNVYDLPVRQSYNQKMLSIKVNVIHEKKLNNVQKLLQDTPTF